MEEDSRDIIQSSEFNTLPIFPEAVYEARLNLLRERMTRRNVEVCLISAAENIYYLTGLNHQGYFAFHMLIVPLEGELIFVARAMEQATVAPQVKNSRFVGFPDHVNPAEVVYQELLDANLHTSRIGLEKDSLYLTVQVAEFLQGRLREADWMDISGLVSETRFVQSPIDIEYTQQAIGVAGKMMQAAYAVTKAGVSERDVVAEIYRAMVLGGGEYPGFHPFVRSTPTLHQEHVTWSHRILLPGDVLFIELAGCVNRYHAPMGRLLYIEDVPEETRKIEKICLDAFDSILNTMKPGIKASDVYRAWQRVIDDAGLSHYRRHHCGYLVGIAFPPSWTGGNNVIGLREGNDFLLEAGMVFHTMSWLMQTGQGDYFVSDTVIVTDDGCEAPSLIPRELHIA